MDLKIIESLSVHIKIKKELLKRDTTQLTRLTPLKKFVVFVRWNLKLCINVVNITLDAIVYETVNINNLMNKRNLEIIQLPTLRLSQQNFGINW